MTFSMDEVTELMARVNSCLASGALNKWQTDFLMDIRDKFRRSGTQTRLSQKQLSKLREITDAHSVPRPKVVALRSSSHTKGRTNYATSSRPRRPSTPIRTPRWGRKSHRLVMFGGVLFLLFAISGFFERSVGTSSNTVLGGETYYAVSLSAADISVTDGDTVRVTGERSGVRLVGFNTPETNRPQCSREAELGRLATQRLAELLRSAQTINFEKVRCACQPGTEGTDQCNFGRSCGAITVDRQDVGQTLISEGLAVPFVCGRTSCPPTPSPWCN